MSHKPIIRALACILIVAALIGYWFWNLQRSWAFVQAAGAGNIVKVRAGLDSGFDPNKTKMKGATALRFAVDSRKSNPDMVRLLLDRGADPNDGLPLAVVCQRADLVQMLISRGADVNPKIDASDGSLLLIAAQTGNNKIIRILKAAGARK